MVGEGLNLEKPSWAPWVAWTLQICEKEKGQPLAGLALMVAVGLEGYLPYRSRATAFCWDRTFLA